MIRGLASAAFGLALATAALVPTAQGAERGLTYMVPAASGSVQRVASITGAARQPIGDMVLADGSNLPVHLSRYKGYVVVINFYSMACGPCIKDLLYINRLQGNFPTSPLVVMAVSEDQKPPKDIKDFLKHQNLGFLKPFSDPNGSVAAALGMRGLPSSLIIDKSGRLAGAVEGNVVWDSPDVQSAIGKLIRE